LVVEFDICSAHTPIIHMPYTRLPHRTTMACHARSAVLRGRQRLNSGGGMVTKDHGPSVKNDKQYEGLPKKG
jgi:hypothetical protein